MTHDHFMQRAIALASLAEGRTHPNPMVGAVLVRDGRILGEGHHRQAGLPHAEVEALAAAGRRARGADLYVTLEPCCHYGRTPPCTDAIIRAGVRRVIYGMRDPNPRVRGRGLRALRRAGIRIVGPVAERECRWLNPAFIHWATTGRPYVIAKVGATLDGKIADRMGRSQWITNAAARAYTRSWRARVDAVLIGHRTLTRDDPRLTVRGKGYQGPEPQPIVLLGRGPIPRRGRLLRGGAARPVLWVVTPGRLRAARRLARLGHDVIAVAASGGRFDLRSLLRALGRRGITAILVEGGGATLGAFFRADCVDYAIVGIAPTLLGGGALGWTEALRVRSLRRAVRLDVAAVRRFGDNVVIEGTVKDVHRNY